MIDDFTDRIWVSLPVATLVIDEKDYIAQANPAAEALINCSASALVNKPAANLPFPGMDILSLLKRVRHGNSSISLYDAKLHISDRAPIFANIQLVPIAGNSQQLLMCIQSRELEVRLRRGGKFSSAAKSVVGLGEMLAHEVKNPLAAITGAAQLLTMSVPKKDAELTNLIVEEARRILGLVGQVEQFGDMSRPEFTSLNIHNILERARHVAEVGFAAGTRIETDFDPSLPPVRGNRDQMLQVFLNILHNAADAVPSEGGRIRIRTLFDQYIRVLQEDGNHRAVPIQVEVIDNGPGIPEDIAQDLFDPFVSGRKYGTGLGLALVSTIVKEHGGWISVTSDEENTVFRVSLPLAQET